MRVVFLAGFGLGLVTSIFVLNGCSSSSEAKEGTEEAPINAPPRPGEGSPSAENPGSGGGGADDQGGLGGGAGPSTSCPADLAAAKQISDATDAEDLQIVEGKVFFRRAKALHRVNLDGQGAATQVAAGNQTVSTRYFVDNDSILEINGSMRAGGVVKTFIDDAGSMVGQWSRGWGGGAGGGTTTTPPEAANVIQNLRVFGADANQYYATDGSKDGTSEVVTFAMSNVNLRRVKKIAAPLTDAQSLGGGMMFFVSSAKDIMKLDTNTGADATLFASEPGCRLALGKTEALCSGAAGVVAFDLATAAKRSVLEVGKSKSVAGFGAAISDAATGALFVSSSAAAADATKHVLREVKIADGAERLLACGREGAITSVAFDAKTVVFVEASKGIFAVAR